VYFFRFSTWNHAGKNAPTSLQALSFEPTENKLKLPGQGAKTPLKTGGEDPKTPLKTSGEDAKTPLKTSGEDIAKVLTPKQITTKLVIKSPLPPLKLEPSAAAGPSSPLETSGEDVPRRTTPELNTAGSASSDSMAPFTLTITDTNIRQIQSNPEMGE
jgi:hypothetical protein